MNDWLVRATLAAAAAFFVFGAIAAASPRSVTWRIGRIADGYIVAQSAEQDSLAVCEQKVNALNNELHMYRYVCVEVR